MGDGQKKKKKICPGNQLSWSILLMFFFLPFIQTPFLPTKATFNMLCITKFRCRYVYAKQDHNSKTLFLISSPDFLKFNCSCLSFLHFYISTLSKTYSSGLTLVKDEVNYKLENLKFITDALSKTNEDSV